jgi:hypothetical protein
VTTGTSDRTLRRKVGAAASGWSRHLNVWVRSWSELLWGQAAQTTQHIKGAPRAYRIALSLLAHVANVISSHALRKRERA